MLFPTLNFGFFFLLTFVMGWLLLSRPKLRLGFLIAASYVFYGFWDWRFCLLLLASSAGNWLMGRAIFHNPNAAQKQKLVIGAVGLNLAILGFFKYCNFFIGSMNDLLGVLTHGHEVPFLDVVLPVGISFFTFHGISYVVDIYRGTIAKPATFAQMLMYIAFFPHLVAGPIVRAAHFIPQLAKHTTPHDIKATRAFLLILGGLFKKVVVANYLSTDFVDDAFFDPSRYNPLDLLLATYGYAIQIYCDFSAYTDIAIGIAALMGYEFPQNFNQPYRSTGLRDFWQRWHMSLSSWLRDYLYISMGGNQGGWKRYRNLLATMLLGGLWHGAAWNYVIWGGLHGLMLVGEHFLFPSQKAQQPRPLWQQILSIVVTFHLVCLTWIFFRAADLDHAWAFFAGFGNSLRTPLAVTPFVLLLIGGGIWMHFWPKDRLAMIEATLIKFPMITQGALIGALIVIINNLGPTGVAPFIYFQF